MSTTYDLTRGRLGREQWEICGVTVHFNKDRNGVSPSRWKTLLEEWLPRYESVGWLEGFDTIIIAADSVPGDGVGKSNLDGSITLENTPETEWQSDLFVNDSFEAILTHEFIHHAHIVLNNFDEWRRLSNKEMSLKKEVSYYSGKCIGEAVAEIGTGIVFDHDIPPWAHEYYLKKDGPEGVYEI